MNFKEYINESPEVKSDLGSLDSDDYSELKDWYYGLTDGLYSETLDIKKFPESVQKEIKIIEKARQAMLKALSKQSLGKYL